MKTHIFEAMHEKILIIEKKNLLKNRDKTFLIRNHAKRQKLFENL